jgi:uncharacterized protein YbjT (DUF2867 family)
MILVTGGTGFVGRNLVRELTKDFRVRCLVRDPGRARGLIQDCELVPGDISDPASILNALSGDIEAVVHLVGILVQSKKATFRAVHVEGTRNVVEACVRKGVKRYLHISALGTRENAISAYHRTKWEAEEIIRASGLEYTIFRPSVIFGKEDKFTNLFASLIRAFPVIFVPGNGRNRMQPVFVRDLVKAMCLSVKTDKTRNKVYEVAGPRIYTFDEILDSIAEAVGKKRLKVHIPMPLMRLNAAAMEAVLPRPPLTRDQLIMLEEDNITSENALRAVFGIEPTGFIEGMRTYIH